MPSSDPLEKLKNGEAGTIEFIPIEMSYIQKELQDQYNVLMKKHGFSDMDAARAGVVLCSILSFYMMGMGLVLLFIPNLILSLFGFAPTHDIWIRILGLFTFCAGMLYFYCGRTNQMGFFRISVTERIVFFLGIVGIVLFLPANPILILIGSVDLFRAIWTALTLRYSS